jgi:hypothetical protein
MTDLRHKRDDMREKRAKNLRMPTDSSTRATDAFTDVARPLTDDVSGDSSAPAPASGAA